MNQFILEDDNEVSVLQMEVDDPNFPLGYMISSSTLNILRDQKANELKQINVEALDDFVEWRKPESGRLVGRPPKLIDAHPEYLVKLVDDNDTELTLDQMMENLTGFMGLQISKSAFHEFARTKCRISCKRAHFQPEKRNSPEKIEQRYNWVKC
ncbi:hypothetical protein G6F37_010715 [Rhizopus arrhizus]|nr:hypothetical protein G6F38_008484 [Rhizopus arrhizus]KAG1153009.1 hypothetical protein G6F37_010715 [Rhizopus arrhizus]